MVEGLACADQELAVLGSGPHPLLEVVVRYVRLSDSDRDKESRGKALVMKVLSRVLPLANPDFEDKYDQVTEWWLEIDDDGLVRREIGLDSLGKPLVGAPIGDNEGIFTELGQEPQGTIQDVDRSQFDVAWSTLNEHQ